MRTEEGDGRGREWGGGEKAAMLLAVVAHRTAVSSSLHNKTQRESKKGKA